VSVSIVPARIVPDAFIISATVLFVIKVPCDMMRRFEFIGTGAKCNFELLVFLGNIRLGNLGLPRQKSLPWSDLRANISATTIMGSAKTKRKDVGGKSAKRKRRKKARTEGILFCKDRERGRELTVTIVSSSSESSSSENENEVVGKPVETRDEEQEKADVVCISNSI